MSDLLAAVLAVAAAMSGEPAPAAAPQPTASEQPLQAAKPPKPKLVCRTNQVTGSRLGAERICKTQEEWNTITRDSRDRVDSQLRRGLQVTCPQNVSC